MAVQQYDLVAGDWTRLEEIINDLTSRVVGQIVSPTSTPTFSGLTLTSLNISGLTATRILFSGADGLISDDAGLTYDAVANALTVVGTLAAGTVTGANVTSGADPGHTHSASSITEADPVFVASPAYGIESGDITNWDTAYGWGNHASAGYLTAEADTLATVVARGADAGATINVGAGNTLTLASGSITDSTGSISFGDELLDCSGRLVLGGMPAPITPSANTALYIWKEGGSVQQYMYSFNDLAATSSGIINFIRTRGDSTTPTAVQTNDTLGRFLFGGQTNTTITSSGGVFAYCDGAVGSGTVPVRIAFVTGTSSILRYERFIIKSNGELRHQYLADATKYGSMIIDVNGDWSFSTSLGKLILNDAVLVTDKLAFTQTDLNEYIDSLTDGYMDYGATLGHRFNNDILPATDNANYLGKNDDDSPAAWKGLILKDQTDGKYYRIELNSGAVSIVDLTD